MAVVHRMCWEDFEMYFKNMDFCQRSTGFEDIRLEIHEESPWWVGLISSEIIFRHGGVWGGDLQHYLMLAPVSFKCLQDRSRIFVVV